MNARAGVEAAALGGGDSISPASQEPAQPDAAERVLARCPVPESDGSGWLVLVSGEDDELRRVQESLLTVADGVIGTRGSLEEDGSDTEPAVYVAGIYDTADGAEKLLDVPSWAVLGMPAPLAAGTRILDLRTGVVWRIVTRGEQVLFRSARWACIARPGTAVLVARSRGLHLDVESSYEETEVRSSLGSGVYGLVDTNVATGDPSPRGADTSVVRIASYVPYRRRPSRPNARNVSHRSSVRAGAERLLAEQEAAWSARWAQADAEVVGDVHLTRALRLAILHLSTAAADRGEAAVGARGLSGPAYAGHVFWDADVFVLPVLAATHPRSARAMLEYRVRRLKAAQRNASLSGRAGARFPWESAHDGRDVTPRSGIDEHGETVPILTGQLEEHITADVAWAAWQFAAWTGRWRFLETRGKGLLIETARYWSDRIRLDSFGHGHIDGVIGPDEYHENVDDNAFTNSMAAWNLRKAAELVRRTADDVLRAEAGEWEALAAKVVDGYNPSTGRHEQFAGFERLEPLLVSQIGSVPMAADLVLGRERLAGSQVIKQADVLMAHHLIPRSMPDGSLEHDVEYYLPRTAHGSSLSPAVHASVLARMGRISEALELLELAVGIDMDDLTGTTAGGLHMAALGGIWQAVVFGFGGLEVEGPDDSEFVLSPHVPEGWGELRFRVKWHGHPVSVRCLPDAVHISCPSAIRVRVASNAPRIVRSPGEWIAYEESI
jgi:trehalose/maltose hydrolase-like predicted phosphorylase